jgi:hypothetical protein
MNPKPIVAFAVLSCAMQVALATFGATTFAIAGGTALTGATTSVAGAGTLIAGIALLKGIALLALSASQRGGGGGNRRGGSRRGGRGMFGGGGSRRRGRRDANADPIEIVDDEEEEEDLSQEFGLLSQIEPAQCYRRLICDLSTGQMPHSRNDVIATIFGGEEQIDISSPAFEYGIAAQVGRHFKNVKFCELRYSCPLTGAQLIEATK